MRASLAKLGKAISSAGSERFATDLYMLLADTLPLATMRITEWTLNESAGTIAGVQLLGISEADRDNRYAPPAAEVSTLRQSLRDRIFAVHDRQLIHLNPRVSDFGTAAQVVSHMFQCHLVSRKANRRYVISLLRSMASHRDFSLQEMSFLKNFSDTLLPLVEWHAMTRRTSAHGAVLAEPAGGSTGIELLRNEFESRLARVGVALSPREREICIGLLSGRMLREMASELGVKESSADTYLKRAAIKLGVSGRHGLTKWMLSAGPCESPI
ncbi:MULTISPECIES: helix-turn-helix transcriptional regulator [Burkholderia]|uniref:helix-turn-helix transcriptional regulator n=1 Tax=Burkholderia TaxID=32008 RepID=UPI00075E7036|nr:MULTISPECIES: LuxR C-terminal-related transcriptional regulator [Burkholderia]KVM69243.1 helix-turn-helix transcriptional regulator [Burkholderia gladioli]NBI50339.1 LuxR family transcriptional regulator [Burkholderia sp. ISTR5]